MAIVTMRILCNNALLLGLLLLLASTTAYQPSKAANTSRREHLVGLITTSVVAWTTASSPAVAVLGSGECASGVGEGCVDRSDGNAYIKSLQEKSAVTKDMYAQVRAQYAIDSFCLVFLITAHHQHPSCLLRLSSLTAST